MSRSDRPWGHSGRNHLHTDTCCVPLAICRGHERDDVDAENDGDRPDRPARLVLVLAKAVCDATMDPHDCVDQCRASWSAPGWWSACGCWADLKRKRRPTFRQDSGRLLLPDSCQVCQGRSKSGPLAPVEKWTTLEGEDRVPRRLGYVGSSVVDVSWFEFFSSILQVVVACGPCRSPFCGRAVSIAK